MGRSTPSVPDSALASSQGAPEPGLLTPAPITKGSRVRLKQPKLPEGTWDITVWDAPSYFEWTQKSGGTTSVAGHWVDALARA